MLDTWRISVVSCAGPAGVCLSGDGSNATMQWYYPVPIRKPEDAEVLLLPLRAREQSRRGETRETEKDTASKLPQEENGHKIASRRRFLLV